MIKKILKKLLGLLPLGRYIVFESIPDLSDNTKAVFDKMVELGLNKKYKFVWCVSDKKKYSNKKDGIIYIDTKTRFNSMMSTYYILRAKCLISCNSFLISILKKQKSFYLTHGTAIKSVRNYYNVPDAVDYMLIASEPSKKMMSYEFRYDENKIIALGYPRNDFIQNASRDLHNYFETDYKKIIVWYPTFRQHKKGFKTGSTNALPIISDSETAITLNEFARKHNTLIVIKPHFVQDISYIKNNNLSNICFIDDTFFVTNKISSYEFVGSCDALITDYSSIYYDYLLCNKPIALIWEDIQEYKKNPGFAVDIDYIGKAAEKIFNLYDFEKFIDHVSNGVDYLEEERREINEWANYSDDSKNTERVVDFIIEKANLK